MNFVEFTKGGYQCNTITYTFLSLPICNFNGKQSLYTQSLKECFYSGFATERFTTKKYHEATKQFTTIGFDSTIKPHSGYECKDFVCSEGDFDKTKIFLLVLIF